MLTRAAELPLVPQPRNVQVIEGVPGLVIDTEFTASVDGAGASDSRIAHAIPRFLAELSRETGTRFVRLNDDFAVVSL